ncbi:MAG: carboxymuconolactone decarboxylase family protein [Rhodospirillales bacterium]
MTSTETRKLSRKPRILPLEPPYDAVTGEGLAKMMPPGMAPLKLFRTMAKSPALLKNLSANGKLIFRDGSLTPLHREIVIQRTSANCGAEYEWGVHAALFGERVGLTGERLAATVTGDGREACWSEAEALLIEFVDRLHHDSAIDDGLWARMARHWSEAQMLELAVLAGFYHSIAYVISVARVEREAFAPEFPVS